MSVHIARVLLLFSAVLWSALAMSQTPAPSLPTDPAERAAAIKAAEEELDWLKKQKDLQQARLDLASLANPDKANKSDIDAQKDLLASQKDLATAQTNAKIAEEIGTIPSASYSGAVELGEKSGTVEANLLAAKSVKKSGVAIASRLTTIVAPLTTDFSKNAQGEEVKETRKTEILLYYHGTLSGFQRVLDFEAQRTIVRERLGHAFGEATAALANKPPSAAGGPIFPVVGAAIQGLSNLASFFKSDYSFKGVDITLNDTLLLAALAEPLREKGYAVRTPNIFEPSATQIGLARITASLGDLTSAKTSLAALVPRLDEAIKTAAGDQKVRLEGAKALTTEAIKGFDTFFTSLSVTDQNSANRFLELARDIAIKARLDAGAKILLVRVEHSGGGYFVRKNIISGLGGAPLFHMGGATVSYMAFSGDGALLAADVVPSHSGFVKSKNILSAVTN